MTHTDRTPYCTKIRYGITGAPTINGDDMDGTHAPGVGLAPVLIELVYSAPRDGKAASVSASVTGDWTRFGERADGQVITHFTDGPDGWPDWLAEEARLHDPDAPAGVAPATDHTSPSRRAGLRDELARAIHRYDHEHLLSSNDIPSEHHRGEADVVLAVLYREWPWLRAEAEEAADDRGSDLIEEYLRFLRGLGPEPDLSGLPPARRKAVAGQFEIVKAIADRDPALPPLDRDPVALRLGLLPASTGQTHPAALLARVHEWVTGEVVTAKTEFGDGYRAAQRDIRDLMRGRFDADAANEMRRAAAEPADETPVDPWSIQYHRFGPARLNPGVCTCGLGPDAVIHNEPPHDCSSRPTAPHQIPIAGLCTLCHHHETAACHTTAGPAAGRQTQQEAEEPAP